MALNTHYSGRLKEAIDRIHKEAPKKFYEIFTSYNYFDVADENNSLTPEQRAQVAENNQHRFSDFSKAIADMLKWYFGDDDTGLVTTHVQGIVDKLDVRSSANAAKTDTIGNSISTLAQGPLLPLQGINVAQQVAGSQVAAVMGTSIFDPDLIPPIGFGMNFSLPGNIANIYKSGFFQPNWNFLYDFEYKNPKFYTNGTGGLKIGTGIDVGTSSEIFLKNVFNVASVSENLTPLGDPVGGITSEDYQKILKAKKLGIISHTPQNDPESKLKLDVNKDLQSFSLNDFQMRLSFYKLVDANLWQPINNRKNWVNGHWGALGHNSCPDFVRTAVSSYIWDTGMAIEPNKSDEGALISYCLQMGIYYLTGFQYKVNVAKIIPSLPQDSGASTEGATSDFNLFQNGQNLNDIKIGNSKVINEIPKNKNIANTYFTWIADILVRVTHNVNGDKIALDKRKRRIAEANLIYHGLGLPSIEFGTAINELSYLHTPVGLKDRKFNELVKSTITRYQNTGAPGGNPEISEPTTSSVNIVFASTVNPIAVSDYTQKVIKKLCSEAGISSITITSAARNAHQQARVMFNNLEQGNRTLRYKFPGQQVVNTYDKEKSKGSSQDTIKTAMESKINEVGAKNVSNHSADLQVLNVVDLAPNSIIPTNKKQIFENILVKNTDGLFSKFLGPRPEWGNDPAYHLEIPQVNGQNLEFNNTDLPNIKFTLKDNTNYKSDSAWLAPLAKDTLFKNGLDQIS